MTKKKLAVGISSLIAGLVLLAAGIALLIINTKQASKLADGEFMISVGPWALEDDERVIWDFTEIGSGSLTTNSHANDYSFTWALDGKKLLIETDWLYELEDEYEYDLDQDAGILTLTDQSGKETKFIAAK